MLFINRIPRYNRYFGLSAILTISEITRDIILSRAGQFLDQLASDLPAYARKSDSNKRRTPSSNVTQNLSLRAGDRRIDIRCGKRKNWQSSKRHYRQTTELHFYKPSNLKTLDRQHD